MCGRIRLGGVGEKLAEAFAAKLRDQLAPAFHERMPVILDPPALATWIVPKVTPYAVAPLLVPYAGKLSIEPTKL